MKFDKLLRKLIQQIEEILPDWKDKFLSYKNLKKQLKAQSSSPSDKRLRSDSDADASSAITKEEMDFVRLLDAELDKFNSFFVDKEEEYIIRLKELQDLVLNANDSNEELLTIQKLIVDFHGEMVLLENYSALNYTGLVKILKKHDKMTGALIRLPFIQKVLQEPFFSTELLYKLIKECEVMLDRLFPASEPSVKGEGNKHHETRPATEKDGLLRGPKEIEEIEVMESVFMRSANAALGVLREIRSRSSTRSVFSLPPMQTNGGHEENWCKIPVPSTGSEVML